MSIKISILTLIVLFSCSQITANTTNEILNKNDSLKEELCIDLAQPTATITGPSSAVDVFSVTIDFSESVTGLTLSDFSIENGGVANLSGSGAQYTLNVIPSSDPVRLWLPKDQVENAAGEGNLTSNTLVVTYNPSSSDTVYYNVALNKNTTQSSTYNGGVSNRAVDGNTNGDFSHPDSSVSSTNSELEAWWEVDLGEVFEIEDIELYNQTGGNSTSNYYLLVSEVPFVSTDLTTTLNDPNVTSYLNSGIMASPSVVNVGKEVRYIRVQRVDTGYMTIAEMRAEGRGERPDLYTLLKKQLDGSYVLTHTYFNGVQYLLFKYIEDYAIVSGENDQLKYAIYDWKGETVQSGSMSNSYGVNWQSLKIDNYPYTNSPFYIIEVTNINKNEKYYLRFRRTLIG